MNRELFKTLTVYFCVILTAGYITYVSGRPDPRDGIRRIQWPDVPASVKRTVVVNGRGGQPEKIDKETKLGKVGYKIEVRTLDEKTIFMKVEATGELIELKYGQIAHGTY